MGRAMIDLDTVVGFFNRISSSAEPLFSSPAELFFYIFCFISLHMIIVHLFYSGKPSRRRHKPLNFQRSVLIAFIVLEIVFFSNLLTVEHFSKTLPTKNTISAHHVSYN